MRVAAAGAADDGDIQQGVKGGVRCVDLDDHGSAAGGGDAGHVGQAFPVDAPLPLGLLQGIDHVLRRQRCAVGEGHVVPELDGAGGLACDLAAGLFLGFLLLRLVGLASLIARLGVVRTGSVSGGRVAAAVRRGFVRLGAGGGSDLDGAALGQAWLGGEGGVDGEQGFVDEPHQVLVGGIAAGIGMQPFPLVVTQGKGLRRRSSPTALVGRSRCGIGCRALAAVPLSAAGGQ